MNLLRDPAYRCDGDVEMSDDRGGRKELEGGAPAESSGASASPASGPVDPFTYPIWSRD